MKKMVKVEEAPGQGLIGLLGEVVTLFCINYFYTGQLAGVNEDCVLLTAPRVVYETGPWGEKAWKDAQPLPHDLYVMKSAIEAFGVMK